jgi:acid phosphatase
MRWRILIVFIFALTGAGCAAPPAVVETENPDLGTLWVKHAAEYRALSLQVYQAATAALPRFVDDPDWSAIPGQTAPGLPPAVILDVDETVVSNVDFQLNFEPPFANWKMERWNREHAATPVPGAARFVAAARALGVTVFFVTNRPCEPEQIAPGICEQKRTTLRDLAEAGIETDAAHLLLSKERGWNREKVTRREFIAKSHRVVMLFGDDLGDFLPCVRTKLYAPCTVPATAISRRSMVDASARFWGNGWYVLPNPIHGSWTSAM